jgi:hypothetical protein
MIDSINFLPSALSELPKMVGLEELKKGYFPHLFNRKENQSVVLNHLPDLRYYNPDAMKLKDRKAVFMWYETNYRKRFDFQRELSRYWLFCSIAGMICFHMSAITGQTILLKSVRSRAVVLHDDSFVEDYPVIFVLMYGK